MPGRKKSRKGDEGGVDKPVLLMKTWTAEEGTEYYGKVLVEGEMYECGDCVAMESDMGILLAEILYIFEDPYGNAWVENRWLSNKEDMQEIMPKSRWPAMDDAELFETSEVQKNPAEAIAYRVSVLDENEYRSQLGRTGVDAQYDFFCTKFLDARLKRFMPVGEQGSEMRLRRGRRYSDIVMGQGPDASSSSSDDEEDTDDDDGLDDGEGAATETAGKRRRSSVGPGKVPQDKFSSALESLRVTAVPKSLPCRESQRNQLLQILKGNVQSGGLGEALFVAGMPGTGKTATAREVVSILKEKQAKGEVPSFKLVELNGMRLIKPHQAYSQLWMSLAGEMVAPKRALSKLEQHFTENDPNREFIVLFVDELDYMTTPKQTVLYNLFDWPTRPQSRLVVVGISNTMDLPERCIPRVSSRLTSRLVFPAYKKKELIEIIGQRLAEANASGGNTAFRTDAINLASAKVAAASGDVRTCLKYCCRAIEVCRARVEAAKAAEPGVKVSYEVSVEDVHLSVREITQQAHLLAVKNSAPQERLLLVAICNEIHYGGKVSVEMSAVRERMKGICRAHPNAPAMPNVATTLEMLSRLGVRQVLVLHISRRTPMPDVSLNMVVGDAVQMLRDDEMFARRVLPPALVAEYPLSSNLAY